MMIISQIANSCNVIIAIPGGLIQRYLWHEQQGRLIMATMVDNSNFWPSIQKLRFIRPILFGNFHLFAGNQSRFFELFRRYL